MNEIKESISKISIGWMIVIFLEAMIFLLAIGIAIKSSAAAALIIFSLLNIVGVVIIAIALNDNGKL